MTNNDELLNSLLEKMNEQKKEFEAIESEMTSYMEQSKTLQQKYDEAAIKREQIRGKYTGYYTIYNELKSKQASDKKASENVVDIKTKSKKKVESKESKESKSDSKNQTLTAEEVATLSTITKNQPKDNSNSDIPEYLQSEYNKLEN